MTVRESLADLKLSLALFGIALACLVPATIIAFRSTHAYGEPVFWALAATLVLVCSCWASGLAVYEGLDAFREERRVDYTVAVVSLLPLLALVATSIAASQAGHSVPLTG
jgi:uncharacterized membrane protein YidH (DUF202 family)